jgi:hypothetical protein
MATARAHAVLDAVAKRLESEPQAVLPTLRLLADPDAVSVRVNARTSDLARRVNDDRMAARRAEFRAGAVDTSGVRQLLGGVSRQAVAQRVAHGQLLAAEIGGRLYFPDWQFTADGPRPRLPELIAALLADGRGPLGADALMRRPIEEEAGRSPADLLTHGQFDLALHYVSAVGAGF